jgi:hypothetical protein
VSPRRCDTGLLQHGGAFDYADHKGALVLLLTVHGAEVDYIDLSGGILADHEPEELDIGVRSPRVQRAFLPTVRAARVRQAADNANGAAYADAVPEYAALVRDELPEAVRAVTSGRG